MRLWFCQRDRKLLIRPATSRTPIVPRPAISAAIKPSVALPPPSPVSGSVICPCGGGTTVAGKTVLTYPIPGVPGATATATLGNGTGAGPCAKNCAERIEVRQGSVLTEFLYSNYEDYNEEANKIAAFFPGHIVEKRDGVTILDLDIVETETGNLYVVMPVPESVRRAAQR